MKTSCKRYGPKDEFTRQWTQINAPFSPSFLLIFLDYECTVSLSEVPAILNPITLFMTGILLSYRHQTGQPVRLKILVHQFSELQEATAQSSYSLKLQFGHI